MTPEDGTPEDETQVAQDVQLGSVETNDVFGNAMVAADFDGDGVEDLAVAAMGEKPGSGAKTGSVFIYKGIPTIGLVPQMLINESQLSGSSGNGDEFGFSLAAMKRSGNSFSDLIIGSPKSSFQGGAHGGVVYIVQGSTLGLNVAKHREITRTDGGGTPAAADRFGASLAVATWGGSQFLAVGAPGLVTQTHGTGFAYTFKLAGTTSITVALYDKVGSPGFDHNFGHAVAVGDLDGVTGPDLVVGTFEGTMELVHGLDDLNPGNDGGPGSVYAYKNLGGTLGFAAAKTINEPSPSSSIDRWGYSLAIGPVVTTHNSLVVGAPGFDGSQLNFIGRIFSFQVDSNFGFGTVAGFGEGVAGLTPQGADRLGTALSISNLSKNPSNLSSIIATAPGTSGSFVLEFHHSASWAGSVGTWVIGTDGAGNTVFPQGLSGLSIAAGDFSLSGTRDIVSGEPLRTSSSGASSSGAFIEFHNSGTNTFFTGPYFDEATN